MITLILQQESTFTSSAISLSTFGGHRIRSVRNTSGSISLHLFHKKLSPYTIRQHTAALRFFFFKTLRRNFPR